MRRWMLAFVVIALLVVSVADAAITAIHFTVQASPLEIVSAQPFPRDIAITNRGTGGGVFIGDSTVTTNDGFEIDQDMTISFTALANTAIFGVVSSGTEEIHIIIVN